MFGTSIINENKENEKIRGINNKNTSEH